LIGIDLCEEYVEAGNAISGFDAVAKSLANTVTLSHCDATDLSNIPNASIDKGYMLHVGMNIADKRKLAEEISRVLKPGGLFGVFDMVSASDGSVTGSEPKLLFPLPFASLPEHAFLAPPSAYIASFEAAGMACLSSSDKTAYCLDIIMRARQRQGPPNPLGPQIVMGSNVADKMRNVVDLFKNGNMEACEMIFEKRS
jgi:SAM-dependent methyltransferase